jgi:hypothetical protein
MNFKKPAFPNLDFGIKPERWVTGKERKISKDVSEWLGPAKLLERRYMHGYVEKIGGELYKDYKQICLSIPVTGKNLDYNSRTFSTSFGFLLQLSSGRIEFLHESSPTAPEKIIIPPLSTRTYEYTFSVDCKKEEEPRILIVYEGIPFAGFPGAGGYRFYGFLPITETKQQ